jgi:hypothetical protein
MILFVDFAFALGGEWMSEVAGAAAAFVVFVMGIPALISQTFIPDGLRSLHKEYLDGKWASLLWKQITVILILLLMSVPGLSSLVEGKCFGEWIWALVFYSLALWVLIVGTHQLIEIFKATKNPGQALTEKIVADTIETFDPKIGIAKKTIDDLGVISREIPLGSLKTQYLEEIEKIIEYLLDLQDASNNAYIDDLMQKVISPCVNVDPTKVNEENVLKALDILALVYHKTHQSPLGSQSYLIPKTGRYICEIGLKAIQRNDLSSFKYATDKLALIAGASREMYILGDAALRAGYMPQAVTMVRKLSSRVRLKSAEADLLFHKDKRSFSWLGLIARLHQQNGSAQRFAEAQLTNMLRMLDVTTLKALFDDAQIHFYKSADFSSADAVLELQKKRYPATLQSS